MQFFLFNNETNSLEIDEYSILLVKEFKDLWDQGRNKCKEDKTGKLRLRAFKELTYIYLVLDFKSPYFQYKEKEKHDAAVYDSGMTEDMLKDETFLAAFRKYKEIQDSDPILSLIKTSLNTLFKMQVWLNNIDFEDDIDDEGRLLYKPKEIFDSIASIDKMRDQLIALETKHKKNLSSSGNSVRGDVQIGFKDS